MLWPPDQKLTNVNSSVQVQDTLSGPAGFTLQRVSTNESDAGAAAMTGWDVGTADTNGQLLADRDGSDSGRVYTLVYVGTDQAGNSASCSTTIAVPHDHR